MSTMTAIGTIAPSALSESPGFAQLDKARQILVFQTIQEAITANPPRPEATFERVVTAYVTLSQVVDKAARGLLSDDDLARLEQDVDSAGGVIAPGLVSQGENSLTAFRAATFGLLSRHFSPAVADAACQALNARLNSLQFNELGRVFHAIAEFFGPLTPTNGNSGTLQSFHALDASRQVRVFDTITSAITAVPSRSEASFEAVVTAYQAERNVLQAAADGTLSDDHLAWLEQTIEAAGGTLWPDINAHGTASVASLRAATFKALQPMLPADVFRAALAALNAQLRDLRPTDLDTLFEAVQRFFNPLLSDSGDRATLKGFRLLDPRRQTLVFNTIELALAEQPQLEDSIFAAAVGALSSEQALVEAAADGSLSRALVEDLQQAIARCGGVIAPRLRAEGSGSIAAFSESCFAVLEQSMPPEVVQAAITALNVKLKASTPVNLDEVISLTESFIAPLRLGLFDVPIALEPATIESEPTIEPESTIEPEATIEPEPPFESVAPLEQEHSLEPEPLLELGHEAPAALDAELPNDEPQASDYSSLSEDSPLPEDLPLPDDAEPARFFGPDMTSDDEVGDHANAGTDTNQDEDGSDKPWKATLMQESLIPAPGCIDDDSTDASTDDTTNSTRDDQSPQTQDAGFFGFFFNSSTKTAREP
jgi:hypothetical protein